ncbi:toxin-antitoxin system TumE family protein [Janthinobacterium sp. EB271-G4-7A]|uniref:toxin-antitoxin system TumE family protein n=1 Tax=Janthinobacterium sp. EB271-G4-7A TaxID=2775056 RepID=UPI001E5BCFBC|nr:DUF6516 family protein [Janthinobacterium sp. EB271-G4-7A]MCC7697089.1 hypothetical protein [Janthinobacterium sp. EB271-G4-7A]
MERYAPPDVNIKKKLGGGVLKELVIRELPSRKVLHYALAYINTNICAVDNGRVIGYDNSHGFSHKHYYGIMTPEQFNSYEEIYDAFQTEWMHIAMQYVNGGK